MQASQMAPLSFLFRKSFRQSTDMLFPQTLTDVLRIARHFSQQALETLDMLFVPTFIGRCHDQIGLFYAINQRNVLFDDCFKRSTSSL
ncbi:hypothetical protein, partial [Aquibacillus rhizosphaerae]